MVEHEGTLEHFAGDGIMMFFNDPAPQEDHAARAVRMALAIRERFVEISEEWRRRGHVLQVGIGIATGYATMGRIGFEGRYDYGGVGNAIILASRLSGEAEANEILIAPRTFAAVDDSEIVAEPAGERTLKGFSRPLQVYTVEPTPARRAAQVSGGLGIRRQDRPQSRQEDLDGTARRQERADLRRRQRSFDRLGDRQGVPRRGRRRRLLVDREPRRAAGEALAESIGSTFVEPADVQSDADIERVFERWGETHDRLDILVHALASRSARTSPASSSTRPATASRSRSTSRPTPSSRWRAPRVPCSAPARRS